jgi:SAM-dependent methyltransferase
MEDPNSWGNRRRRARECLVPWVEQTVPLAGATVLEYGCGHGPVSCAFAERAERVIGVDIDAEAVAVGRELVAREGPANIDLRAIPLERILDEVGALADEIDVFLLYAVLEHLTLEERLAVLRLARDATPAGGAIVVCESPNRLFPFDHHTTQRPFFTMLPDDLAQLCWGESERPDFLAAMHAAREAGSEREALVRWGRGIGYHEFELVFDPIERHLLASNHDPLLFAERPVFAEETALWRYMSRARPDLAPVWSRAWLDLILSPRPHERRPRLLRPWPLETRGSHGAEWSNDTVFMPDPAARLAVALPAPTRRLVVGAVVDGPEAVLVVEPSGADGTAHQLPFDRPGDMVFADMTLEPAAGDIALGLDPGGWIGFVGYEA